MSTVTLGNNEPSVAAIINNITNIKSFFISNSSKIHSIFDSVLKQLCQPLEKL